MVKVQTLLLLIGTVTYTAHSAKSICDLVTASDYPCEEHGPLTPDGFLLGISRIPPIKSGAPPVILQHGLLDSAATWVNNLPYQSLGFILHDQGYDVWLGNSRGNTYSQHNSNFARHNAAYWNLVDFGLMGKYDLTTFVEYVLRETGKEKLTYIGHSQGTTQAFASFSMNYNNIQDKINLFVALAPATYVKHQKSPIISLLADAHIDWILNALGEHQFFPNNALFRILGVACDFVPLGCDMGLFLVTGPSKASNINGSRLDYYLNWEPADTSVHNMVHWAQEVRTGGFEMFNWGKKNGEYYNSTSPPSYDLEKVKVPTAVFTGGDDWLADPTDVVELVSKLPNIVFLNDQPDYAHMDFVWGLDAHIRIYPNITNLLGQYNK